MTASGAASRCCIAPDQCQRLGTQHILALPQPLLELILIPSTSRRDKRALRQACKLFQQTLDCNLTCIKLLATKPKHQKKFLEAIHCVHGLKAAILDCGFDALLGFLPRHLTTLKLHGARVDLKELKTLPFLTSLYLNCKMYCIGGLEHVCGLTRLHTYNDVGSLAHLAPTLKYLFVEEFENVDDVDQLTNLEVLGMQDGDLDDFFGLHGHLPLKHMCLDIDTLADCSMSWASAPRTLTRLTLRNTGDVTPGSFSVLPTSITHLQVQSANSRIVEGATTALPWLRSLNLSLILHHGGWNTACLSKLTNLRTLGVCLQRSSKFLTREEILLTLPGVRKAVDSGLKLNVMRRRKKMFGSLRFPCPTKSTWATVA